MLLARQRDVKQAATGIGVLMPMFGGLHPLLSLIVDFGRVAVARARRLENPPSHKIPKNIDGNIKGTLKEQINNNSLTPLLTSQTLVAGFAQDTRKSSLMRTNIDAFYHGITIAPH